MVETEEKESEFIAIRTARELAKQYRMDEEEIKKKRADAAKVIKDLKEIKKEMLLGAVEFDFAGRAEILVIDNTEKVFLKAYGNSAPPVEINSHRDFRLLLELADIETTDIRTADIQ